MIRPLSRFPTLPALMAATVTLAASAALGDRDAPEILAIAYQDAERSIDYDFTFGETDNGGIVLPEGAFDAPESESFEWRPAEGSVAETILDTSDPGMYRIVFPDSGNGYGGTQRTRLFGTGAAEGPHEWSWQTETRHGWARLGLVEAADFEGFEVPHTRALVQGHFVDGGEEGTHLFLSAVVTDEFDPMDEDPEIWSEHTTIDLGDDVDPITTRLALRMSASDGGATFTAEYRVEDGEWQTLGTHSGDEPLVAGLPQNELFVEMTAPDEDPDDDPAGPRFFADSFDDGDELDPAHWDESWNEDPQILVKQNDRLAFLSPEGQFAPAVLQARSEFAADEPFRVRVDFEADIFLESHAEIGLVVFDRNAQDLNQAQGNALVFVLTTYTTDDPDFPDPPRWEAGLRDAGQVVDSVAEAADAASGTLYLVREGDTFRVSFSGFDEEDAFAVFDTPEWAELGDAIGIGLTAYATGEVNAEDDVYFDNFAIEEVPIDGPQPDAYADWAEAIPDEALRTPEVSAAGDGVSNLVRYALGADDPFAPVHDRLPASAFEADTPVFTFEHAVEDDNLSIEVEATDDFENWETVAESTGGEPFHAVGDADVTIVETGQNDSTRITITPATVESATFFRLKMILADG